jgi:hypothetical protein
MRGLYLIGDHRVCVEQDDGSRMPMDAFRYARDGVDPPIDALPNKADFDAYNLGRLRGDD